MRTLSCPVPCEEQWSGDICMAPWGSPGGLECEVTTGRESQNQASWPGASAMAPQIDPWYPCVKRGDSFGAPVGAERTETSVQKSAQDRAFRLGCC